MGKRAIPISGRNARMAERYRAGATLREIGGEFGVTTAGVRYILCHRLGMVLRRPGPQSITAFVGADPESVEVPRWVPSDMASRYAEIAALRGEERAASVVRRLKHEARP